MALSVECPECFNSYTVPDKLAGKQIRCKSCSASIQVDKPITLKRTPSQSSASSPAPSDSKPTGKKKKKRKKKRRSRSVGVPVSSLLGPFGFFFSHAGMLVTVIGLTVGSFYNELCSSLAFLYALLVVIGGIRFRLRRGSDTPTELGMGLVGLIAIGVMVKSGQLDSYRPSNRSGVGDSQTQSASQSLASPQTPGSNAQSKLTLYEPVKGLPRFQISNLRIQGGDSFEFDYKVTSGKARTHHTVYVLASHLPSAKTISVTTFGASSGTISGYVWTIGTGSKSDYSLENGCEFFIAERSGQYLCKLSNSLTRGNMAVTQTLPVPKQPTIPPNLIPVPAGLTSFSQIERLQINRDGQWHPVKVVSRLNNRFQVRYLKGRAQTMNVDRSELYIDRGLLASLQSDDPGGGGAVPTADLVRVPANVMSLENAGTVYVKVNENFHRVETEYKIGSKWHIKYLEGPFEGREVDRSEIYIDRTRLAELK